MKPAKVYTKKEDLVQIFKIIFSTSAIEFNSMILLDSERSCRIPNLYELKVLIPDDWSIEIQNSHTGDRWEDCSNNLIEAFDSTGNQIYASWQIRDERGVPRLSSYLFPHQT